MDELEWEILSEVQGRLKGDLLKTYFDSHSVNVEFLKAIVI